MENTSKRPAPPITPESAAYWKAALKGELLIGWCEDCKKPHHAPQAVCPLCWSSKTVAKPASGRGKVNSFAVIHQTAMPEFKSYLPLVIAYVELEEGVSMVSNIVGCDWKSVAIDMPVTATFETVSDMAAIPLFRPA